MASPRAARPRPRRRGRLANLGRQWGWMLAVLLVVGFMAAVALVANGRGARSSTAIGAGAASTTAPGGSVAAPVATAKRKGKTPPVAGRAPVGVATVSLSSLPREAGRTWELIQKGGPFPFTEDGTAYENKAKRLPAQPLGWYREYTVPTPGVPDRGTRRLIVGKDGSPFWTPDAGASLAYVDIAT